MITAPGTLFFFLPYDSIAHLLEYNLLFSLAERILIVFVLIGFGIKSRRKGAYVKKESSNATSAAQTGRQLI